MLPDFPAFTSITLEHKDDYERLVSEYPPFSDISFATLHIWWNLEGELKICQLNGSLVISYNLPFDQENSGLCIIGKRDLDKCIKIIFDYLKNDNQPVKLVHVPEFVIENILDKSNLNIVEELDYNEYILDSHGLASLEDALHGRTRRKVKRFLREVEDREVEIKELDLQQEKVKAELLDAIQEWDKQRPSHNDPKKTEHLAIQKTLLHAGNFNIKHIGLYIDGKLYAIVLYHHSHDKKHYILHHLKVDYSIPFIFDYMTHHIASRAAKEGVDFLNMEMDLGIESLRRHKLGLRPVTFFRKYTVSPL